jgi:ribonuclease PH
MTAPRHDGRSPDQLRRVELHPGFTVLPAGSVLIRAGKTMGLCTASVTAGVPKHRETVGGWLTAEYCMLPGSTPHRTDRESAKGRVQGRTHEIQRLIGRSLRAIIDLPNLGLNTIHLDCEVMQAVGGTRTASITGACVACAIAFNRLVEEKKLFRSPLTKLVAAVSAGIFKNEALLDLNYVEDRDAAVDANFVITESGEFVEIQSAGEETTFSPDQLASLLALGQKGIAELIALQQAAIRATQSEATTDQVSALADFFARR